MGVESEIWGNLAGAPHTLEYNGKTYKLSLINQKVKVAFEKARLSKAKEALAVLKDVLEPEDYRARLDQMIQKYEAGEFALYAESGLAYLQTIPGMCLLLSLVIGCDENEVMGLVIARQAEIVGHLHLIIRESFPGLALDEPVSDGGTGNVPTSAPPGEASAAKPSETTDPNAPRAA